MLRKVVFLLLSLMFLVLVGSCEAKHQTKKFVVVEKLHRPKATSTFGSIPISEKFWISLRPISESGGMTCDYKTIEVVKYDYDNCQLGDTLEYEIIFY